jgi:hypothetical protein
MKSLSHLSTCLLITGFLFISACVFAGPGHDARGDHGDRQAQAGHDDGGRGCGSDHQRDGCEDPGHH